MPETSHPVRTHQGLTEKMDKHGRNSQGRTHTHTVTEVFNFGPERSRHPSLGIFWFVSWTFLIYIYQYLLCPFDVFIWVALDSLEQCICQIICASPAHRCLFSVPCSTSLSAVEPVVLKQWSNLMGDDHRASAAEFVSCCFSMFFPKSNLRKMRKLCKDAGRV